MNGNILYSYITWIYSDFKSIPGEDLEGDSEGAEIPSRTSLKPGEYVMRNLFAEFVIQADKKITTVMAEPFVSSPWIFNLLKILN